ncbi:hypothetical protein Slin14017_G020860 [Septoria linicola]|nr:hypothetical protein Slin14017_G020860 [Septoria linicola]
MASLIALPIELLVLIFEHVGGRELRRSQTGKPPCQGPGWRATDRLMVCREWYAAARSVYTSGLHVSELRLYACNLDRLKGELSYSDSRTLMHKNTRSLAVRLLGHFWDNRFAEDIERWHAEDGWCGPFSANEEPPGMDYISVEGIVALDRWRDSFAQPCLEELFADLRHFAALKYLDMTASSDPHAIGPDWNYIHQSTVHILLRNLPLTQSLRTLVLDTSGTRLVGDWGLVHTCEEIAGVLPYVENVRLRMISICPCIFNIPRNGQRPSLKTLIVKLYLPFGFEHTSNAQCEPCMQMHASLGPHDRLYSHMRRAAPVLLDRLAELRSSQHDDSEHGMTGFMLSYRSPDFHSRTAWNCLEDRGTDFEAFPMVGPENADWDEFMAEEHSDRHDFMAEEDSRAWDTGQQRGLEPTADA